MNNQNEIKIIINLPPVTKKNSQQILINKATNRPFVMPSKKYKEFEKDCGYFIKYKNSNISKPVNIKCLYFMQTKRQVDLTNLLGATMDMLVHYKVIEDDNSKIVASHDGSRVFYDKLNPRTEIYITLAKKAEYGQIEGE